MPLSRGLLGTALLGSMLAGIGCRGEQLAVPYVNSNSAAAGAMRAYDADKNGALDATELAKAPALKNSLTTMDTNTDGILSHGEIASRAVGDRGR